MSRRRRTENPVSLFPFVAVMASTMGALILLLLVTARQASKTRDAAWLEEQRESKRLPKLPPLPGLVQFPELPPLPPHQLPELVERKLPSLPPLTDPRSAILARKTQIERELADLRKRRERTPAAGEDRLAPLMREAAMLRSRLERILDERKAAQKQLAERRLKAEEALAAKDRVEEQRRRSPHQFAVTPYFGPNATNRRPIYLECTKDAVVLQPEGVSIATAVLERDARGDNPLARLVYAVTDHRAKSDSEPPYPLLLVRPDGVHSYYVARSSLEFLRFPFGYELVGADQQIAFPAADDSVKRLAQTAILERRRTGGIARNDGPSNEGGANSKGGSNSESGTTSAIPSATASGAVPAIAPAEEADEPAEIGASVRDYIARRQGMGGGGRGLGALSVASPTPFESSPTLSQSARGGRRDRSQTKVEGEIERPQPTLSERLQGMVQDAPIPLPGAKPQTQQWQPGLEGMERSQTASAENASAPAGPWSPTTTNRPRQRPSGEPSQPTTIAGQLWNAANNRGNGSQNAARSDEGWSRSVERTIRIEVRTNSLIIEGETLALDDLETAVPIETILSKCFAAVDKWGDPPTGGQWRPRVLLLVRSSAMETAGSLRASLASYGLSVKHVWVDDNGVPTLLPSWGN